MRAAIARSLGLSVLLLVVLAGQAAAHVEPTPAEAVAGTATAVTLAVEHGCSDTEPTTALEVRVPEGATEIDPDPKPGFEVTVEGDVIAWSGGSAGGHDEPFSFSLVMPDAPGETVYFPTIQICGATEVAWIELPADDGAPPELPAPAISLRAPLGATSTSAEATTTSPTAPATSTTVAAADDDDADDDGAGGWLVPALVAGAVLAAIAGALAFRRRGAR